MRTSRQLVLALVALVACKDAGPEAKQAPVASAKDAGAVAGDPWAPKPQAPLPELPCPFYWTVVKDGTTSYLVGTIHASVEARQLPKPIWDDLERAPAFAMEADTNDPTLLAQLRRPGGSLRAELGPDYWKKLEDAIGAGTAAGVDAMKPMVAVSLIVKEHVPGGMSPMDLDLLARAQTRGKRIVFLEEIAAQLAATDKHLTARSVKEMLDEPDRVGRELVKLVDAYKAGDAAAFLAVMAEQRAVGLSQGYSAAELDAAQEDIFYKRNASWVAPIEKLHAAGGGFIAVGAGHLLGERSVVELLVAKGFVLTRGACRS